MANCKTTGQFIKEANIIHNNRYNYSESVYLGTRSLITIECFKHGKFCLLPNKHLSAKRGCHKCSIEEIVPKIFPLNKTLAREDKIISAGYKLITIWESEFKLN